MRRVNKIQVVCFLGKFVPGIDCPDSDTYSYSAVPSAHLKYLVGVCKQG